MRQPTEAKHIALVYLPMESGGWMVVNKREFGVKRVPPLGLQYLSAAVKKSGAECRILDQTMLGFDLPGLYAILEREAIDVVGFYTATFLKEPVLNCIRFLRERGYGGRFITGGPGAFRWRDYLTGGVDMVCHGEGDRTIVEILEYFRGHRSWDQMRGVSIRRDGEFIQAPPQPFIDNPDELPFPDRSQYPVGRFYDYHYFGMRQPYVPMMANRGCPNNCAFCTSPRILGRRVRQRSVANVLEEIRHCRREYGLRYIGFKDDNFAVTPGWAEQFAEALFRERTGLGYGVLFSPFSLPERREEAISLLRRSGLDQVIMGVQSADATVLRNINRRPEQLAAGADLIRLCKKYDITTIIEFILGLPGDTEQSMRADLDYALKLRPHHALFFELIVLEGSEIEEKFGTQGPETGYTKEELRRRCSYYQRHFFTRPDVIARNVWLILRKNPRWFLRMLRYVPYLLRAIGRRQAKSTT